MSTPKPNHQWDVSRLYKNVRTRLRIQQIHMWSWSCDSKASIQMSGSSVQRITAKKKRTPQLKSDMTSILRNHTLISGLGLKVGDLSSVSTNSEALTHWVQMFTSRTKFEEGIWLVRHVQLMSRFVSRKFWDILVYSCSLIAKVSQWSSLKNRFLPHHTSSDIGYCVNYWLVVTVHSHSMCFILYCPIH